MLMLHFAISAVISGKQCDSGCVTSDRHAARAPPSETQRCLGTHPGRAAITAPSSEGHRLLSPKRLLSYVVQATTQQQTGACVRISMDSLYINEPRIFMSKCIRQRYPKEKKIMALSSRAGTQRPVTGDKPRRCLVPAPSNTPPLPDSCLYYHCFATLL